MPRRILVACGTVAAALYLGADIVGALAYPGYRYASQAVSELAAIGSPVRSSIVPAFFVHSVLQIAFGIGVWQSADRNRALRVSGGLLAAIGIVDLLGPWFPMHMRGVAPTLTDTMHIALTAVTVLLIVAAIAVGAAAFDSRFRRYSMATLVLLLVAGVLAAMDGARLAANQPTPWLGLTERLDIYGYMAWMTVLSLTLLRTHASSRRAHHASAASTAP